MDVNLQRAKFPELKFILFQKGKKLTFDKIDEYFETGEYAAAKECIGEFKFCCLPLKVNLN